MGDNKTSQPAQEYDKNVEKTIPYYRLFQEEIFHLVTVVNPNPSRWLDTGCGTGILVTKAAQLFADTQFVLADPSEAMLHIAKEKFSGKENVRLQFVSQGTEEVDFPEESFAVITAVLSHHYFDPDTRKKATGNCFKMLKKGGIYIAFETIRLNTDAATAIGLARWRNAQLKNGKSPEAVERHIGRFGIELSPLSLDEHIRLLHQAGFSVAEIFWVSGMQAGFYAIK